MVNGVYMFGLVLCIFVLLSTFWVLVQIFGHVDVDDSRSALFWPKRDFNLFLSSS